MNQLYLLLTFLGGSFFGILVQEIMTYFNKRLEHKRELVKITYARKLEIAEKTVAFMSYYMVSALQIKKSYEFIGKAILQLEDRTFDMSGLLASLAKSEEVLAELSSSKYLEVHSMDLYFDMPESELWKEEDLGKMIEAAVEAKSLEAEVSVTFSNYNFFVDRHNSEVAEKYWKEIAELIPKFVHQLKILIDLYEKNRLAMKLTISTIKNQIKDHK